MHDIDHLLSAAWQARREGRHAQAKQDLSAAIQDFRSTGDTLDLPRALAGLGQIERDLGSLVASLACYEEAADLFRHNGQDLRLAHAIRHVGDLQTELGRADVAEASYREALTIYRSHPQTLDLDHANALRSMALLRNDPALWQEARDLYRKVGVEAGV
ncbi:MAG: hypothetical protein NVS9B15_09530 [Acidobacteriaceae bacterium]